MKKMTAIILLLCLVLGLWGCRRNVRPEVSGPVEPSGGATEAAVPSEATLPASAGPLSQESVLETPQVGEYAESVFLANVAGQARVLLLSVRSDGTLDYIFCTNPPDSDYGDGYQSLSEAGFQYYTLTPQGQATAQTGGWIAQLDEIMKTGIAEAGTSDAAWSLNFSASEGNLLILAQLRGGKELHHSVLYRVAGGQLTQIPIQLTNDIEGKSVTIDPDSLWGLYAAQEVFLLRANSGLENQGDRYSTLSFYVFSYDGSYITRLKLDPEELGNLIGANGNKVWTSDILYQELVLRDAASLSPIASHSEERVNIRCTAVSPDGSCLYRLYNHYDASLVQLDRYTEAGLEPLVTEPLFYAFGNPTTVPSALAAANDGTFYTWTRESGRGVLRQYRYHPEGARETPFFTVYSLEDSQTLRAAVSLWNRTHTDTAFRYVVAADEIAGTALTLDDAVTQLNTQLVNGEGPDVLILDGLPVDSLIDKGFLHPLSGLDTTGVYPKLLERFTAGGELYAVPAKMTPYLLGRKTEDTEPVASLEDFADRVEAATEQLDCSYEPAEGHWDDVFKKAVYSVQFSDQIFDLWYPAWSEAIWEGQSFHPEVYQEFLTQTGRLVDHYSLKTIDELLVDHEENIKTGLTKDHYTIVNATDPIQPQAYPYCLAATNYVGLTNFLPYTESYYQKNQPVPCEILGIPGPDGTGATVPTCIAALREGGNWEAGTEFLQLLLSDEIQMGQGSYGIYSADGYPVKWSCTPALLDRTASSSDRAFQIENSLEEALSQLRPVVLYEIPYNAAKNAALRFYEGKLMAQEAASQAEEETALYLAEQRR